MDVGTPVRSSLTHYIESGPNPGQANWHSPPGLRSPQSNRVKVSQARSKRFGLRRRAGCRKNRPNPALNQRRQKVKPAKLA